jgi:exopolysaccharide production protein ExoQ
MSSNVATICVSTGGAEEEAAPSLRAREWTFWLPLAVVWITLLIVEHSWFYASRDFLEKGDGKDLTETIGPGGNIRRQLSILAVGATGALLLLTRSKVAVTPNYALCGLIATLCGLLVTSMLWSEDAMLSLKRASQPIMLLVTAIGIAKHLRPRRLCLFIAIFTAASLGIGIFATAVKGSLLANVLNRFGGSLHPNAQAVNCAALCLASLGLIFDGHSWSPSKRIWLVLFCTGLFFLLLTRSRTGVAAFVASTFVFAMIGASWQQRVAICGALALVTAIIAIPLWASHEDGNGIAVSAVHMGREDDITSLTGRVPIWQAVVADIAKRPLLGYGYGTFWTPQRVYEYSLIHHWEFNHAHSAYLESTLNVGVIGVSLGLLIIFVSGCAALSAFARSRITDYRFIVAVLVLALINGLVDSSFVIVGGFAPLLVLICISMVMLHGAGAGLADDFELVR